MENPELIKTQATTTADQSKYGVYAALVTTVKRVFTPENEIATAGATHGLPIVRLDNWDAQYMAKVFRAHPGYNTAFTGLLLDTHEAFTAVRNKQKPTEDQIAAVNAVRDLAGPKPEDINRFLTMIRDANFMIQEEQKAAPAAPRKQSFAPSEVPAEAREALRNNGVSYDASNAQATLDSVVLAFRNQAVVQKAEKLAV